MLQTRDLILDKAKFQDWRGMYRYVWSGPECARYMAWELATDEKEARVGNEASRGLAAALGFSYVGPEVKTDTRDGHSYTLLRYQINL